MGNYDFIEEERTGCSFSQFFIKSLNSFSFLRRYIYLLFPQKREVCVYLFSEKLRISLILGKGMGKMVSQIHWLVLIWRIQYIVITGTYQFVIWALKWSGYISEHTFDLSLVCWELLSDMETLGRFFDFAGKPGQINTRICFEPLGMTNFSVGSQIFGESMESRVLNVTLNVTLQLVFLVLSLSLRASPRRSSVVLISVSRCTFHRRHRESSTSMAWLPSSHLAEAGQPGSNRCPHCVHSGPLPTIFAEDTQARCVKAPHTHIRCRVVYQPNVQACHEKTPLFV